MRKVLAIAAFAALAACASTPAAAPSGVSLAPGEGVTVEFDPAGGPRIVARTDRPASLSDRERDMLGGVRDNPAAMGANSVRVAGDGYVASQPVTHNRIEFRLLVVPPHDTVLMIDNGYEQGLIYRAAILVNDRSTPTDVCLVMPSRHGVEHWPYLIDHIELSDLTLRPWRDGDAVPCE